MTYPLAVLGGLLAVLLLRYLGGLRCKICWRGWALYRINVSRRLSSGRWRIASIAVCKRCNASARARR